MPKLGSAKISQTKFSTDISITYPNSIYEVVPSPSISIPTSEPSGSSYTYSFTVTQDYLSSFTANPEVPLFYYPLFVTYFVIQNPNTSSATVYIRLFKGNTAIWNSLTFSASPSTNTTVHLYVYVPNGIQVNDVFNLKISSSTSGCSLTYWCGFTLIDRITPKDAFLSTCELTFNSVSLMPALTSGNPSATTVSITVPQTPPTSVTSQTNPICLLPTVYGYAITTTEIPGLQTRTSSTYYPSYNRHYLPTSITYTYLGRGL